MEEQSNVQSGIVILWQGRNPTLDVVAVHGLGANPNWAWTRKTKDEANEKEVNANWLKDENMLPSKIPNARIMTFNYESRWHKDAPRQRRSLCANQLLTALDNQRKQEEISRYRPLIFIGHSFGGIVIEQALVSANTQGGPFQYLATSTVGIVFLGTPHRGTKSTKWGELIACSGKVLGFATEDRILKDLREDSETLMDLLYTFTLWLFRMSIPVVCFFEQYVTDYGVRVGLSWKELVVEEKSACIDGHRKEPLPTDHLKINKYSGEEDPSYKSVYPVIIEIAKDADEKVKYRLKPRDLIKDNTHIPSEHRQCLQSLTLTDPQDDLASIRRSKGNIVEGTCEWLLVREEYSAWLVGNSPPLLRLIGPPGVGKSMISCFLVGELERKMQKAPNMTFAYYFCDNKDEKRRTATVIIRGLLLQLLRQRPILFGHLQEVYDQMKDQVFTNFDTLWRILVNILKDPQAGEIYILIDAMDECEETSQQMFLSCLTKLTNATQGSSVLRVKFLITCRPNQEIEESVGFDEGTLRVDSAKVNTDLSKFIDVKVKELATTKKSWPASLLQEIKETLQNEAGGTFLWASLVLVDIFNIKIASKVRTRLKALPNSLRDIYDSILRNIGKDYMQDAILLLQWVVVAKRPLTVSELAMIRVLADQDKGDCNFPTTAVLDVYADGFKCCEPLLYRDATTDTINLVHQSAKDYLLGLDLQKNSSLSQFYIDSSATHLLIFQTCWNYLNMRDFDPFAGELCSKAEVYVLDWQKQWQKTFDTFVFFQYAVQHWDEHVLEAESALCGYQWDAKSLNSRPKLRDSWLRRVANHGHEAVVRLLLENGAAVDSKDGYGQTPLWWAARNGHEAVVRLLLENGAAVDSKNIYHGQTPLWRAAENGHEAVVRLLLENGAAVDSKDIYHGQTPLSLAAENGHEAVVRLLLENGAAVDSKDIYGQAPLWRAARNGHEAVVRLLLENGAAVDSKDQYGQTPLWRATEKYHGQAPLWRAARNGHEAVVRLLLENGAAVDSKDQYGQTPLWWAAENGHEAVVRLLLENGAAVDSKDQYGQTPLWWAARNGHEAVVRLLLENGAAVDSKDQYGQAPLWRATEKGHEAVVRLLLENGAAVDSKDIYHGRTPLSLAAENGHEAVVRLLLENGAAVDSKDQYGQTPLWWAARNGHEAVVRLLLENGAAVDSKDQYGQTPLWWAARNGHEAVVRLLLENGAAVDSKDQYGQTPLWWAARNGHEAVVRLLLENGAAVDSKDQYGQTPLWWAAGNRHEAVVQLLENGTKVAVPPHPPPL